MRLPTPPLRRKPPRPGSRPSRNGARVNGGANGAQDPKALKKAHKQAQREAFKQQALEVPIAMLGWLDERTGSTPFLRAFLFRKTPQGTNMYYDPSPTQAYGSIRHIINDVFLGEFVRGMHRWGATVMVVLIFLHMGRTFFFGAYKYPRELNWIIGVVLLILTMAMAFTGYLLPFDQRSFWATVVGVNINASGPIVGPYLADFLRAGSEFNATTLSRFYAIHMLLIPGLIAALIGAHLYLVAKLGTTAPPWLKAEKARELAEEDI
jgi:menaquinol-cytochrome c reductase cytochrome b subunit